MYRSFLLVPSTYGLIGWLVALIFIVLNPVGMFPLSGWAWFIVIYTLSVFMIGTIAFTKPFRSIASNTTLEIPSLLSPYFLVSTTIGLLGLIMYYRNVAAFYGGLSTLGYTLLSNSLDVRSNAEEFGSIGIPMSYFSWISIFFGALLLKSGKLKTSLNFFVILLIIAEFVLNLLFIDRTRPIWIFLVTVLGIMFSKANNSRISLLKILTVFFAPAIMFVVFAAITGKFSNAFGIYGTMSLYIISGIGYLDSLVMQDTLYQYDPIRTFMPISKFLEALGIISDVPEQVLEFRLIPFPTNVGTIHEPYFSDGGLIYLITIFPILVFSVNYLALIGMRARTAFGMFLWANCAFTFIISFFVPKFNTTAFVLFVVMFLVEVTIKTNASKNVMRRP